MFSITTRLAVFAKKLKKRYNLLYDAQVLIKGRSWLDFGALSSFWPCLLDLRLQVECEKIKTFGRTKDGILLITDSDIFLCRDKLSLERKNDLSKLTTS